MAHQCDTSLGTDPSGAPLTEARSLRLIAAYLDRSPAAAAGLLLELEGCPTCLAGVAACSALIAAGIAADNIPDAAALVDLRLAHALDRAAAESG